MSVNIAFTICSINYLAQAITLGNSLKDSNPEVEFRIYLVDKLLGREDIKEKTPFPIIEIETVPVVDFGGMVVRYNIVELNTAVKPFIIDYIFQTKEDVDNIIYFDPDIMVLGKLSYLFEKLNKSTIVLTPQILSPSDDHPYGVDEKGFLATGVYNLGFIGLSRKKETFKFLEWWKSRLVNQGYANATLQLFYDQKWLNLAPIFFHDVYIEKSPGYNMAGWNLHERKITKKDNKNFIINHAYELIFFHFSGVKVNKNNVSDYSSFTFKERPDLEELIRTYRTNLIDNGNDFFSSFPCYYSRLYKGMTIYYPKYHWITIYRRTRFNLGKLRRFIFTLKS